MSNNAPVLLRPNGMPLFKSSDGEGVALRIFGPSEGLSASAGTLRGAEPKTWDYRLYLDMYYNHPMVFSAINKIVKSCTNTGFDFVPSDSRVGANESEVARAKEFFDKQQNFMGELRRIYRDLLIFGDAFMYVVPDRRRRPVKLKRLAPWTMHVKVDKSGKVLLYAQRDPSNPRADPVFFAPKEIMHFKLDDPGNDLYGISPLESLKTTILTDLHMLNFQKQFFQNGASMGTFIIVEEGSDADLERIRAWIRDEYVGSSNAYKPVIISGKGVSITKGVASHEEMSFLAGRNFIIEEILSVLDVPPAKVGRMETANRSNSKEQDKTFRTESVSPLQNFVEDVLNADFVRGILDCQVTRWEHSEADVRDAQEQMELWQSGSNNGLLTINEVRNKMGYADIEGGDVAYIMTSIGATPVDRLNDPPIIAAQMGGKGSSTTAATAAKQQRDHVETAYAFWKGNHSLQSYAALHDAMEEDSCTVLDSLAKEVRRSIKTDDDDLRTVYRARADGIFAHYLNGGANNAERATAAA